MALDKWDKRYIKLAKHTAAWSKDPNAHVGAVVTDRRRRVIALGFNGFPVKVEDRVERLTDKAQKNEMVVHAEENAILIAGQAADGSTLYVYGKPVCSRCAGVIIQAGVTRVVAAAPKAGTSSRWDALGITALEMLNEAGILFEAMNVMPSRRAKRDARKGK